MERRSFIKRIMSLCGGSILLDGTDKYLLETTSVNLMTPVKIHPPLFDKNPHLVCSGSAIEYHQFIAHT